MDIKEKFLQHISVERRLSEKTVEAYGVSLRLFESFLDTMPDPRTLEEADSDNIRDWLEHLMERKRSAAYVNRSLAALHTFYRYCLVTGVVSVDPAHNVMGPKRDKRLPHFLREKEMDRMMEILDDRQGDFDNVRARTIIYMFYLTGLRAAELISLDDNMVDFARMEIKVTGKRNKQRLVPFGRELSDVVRHYIMSRDENVTRHDDALFVDNNGKRMTYEKVRALVKANLRLVSNMQKLTPHVLRHTFATTMLNHDANLESIKKLLGHKSLDTTEIYTHTTFEQLRRIYNEAHPHK
ncbi:MAG: tyrosine-type recombinase/integrase [Prevotella sp.]